ncbi:MAG: LysR family transcriptional regulator [Pseudorhodoplanes sp.]|nr:LysR family transcriptional regulator [Pseudorhodoplanes sp.]
MLQRASIRQFRIFEAASRLLHFGRAAAELHLTQPAVSIQLRHLEEAVGLPLFEQIGRRMHLTAAGRELLVHARVLLERLREADEALQTLKGEGGGELHIAATTTAEYFTPRLLADFRAATPRVKLRLSVHNRETIVRALADNTIDISIMGRAPRGIDVEARAFSRHPLALVASPAHPLAKRRRLRLAQLAGETLLVREAGSGTRTAMQRAFSEQRFQPGETMEIGSNEAIKQAVMAGMGIGFISLHTVGTELADGRLVTLPVAGMPVMRDWFAVHRKGKRLPAAATAFKTFLAERGADLVAKAPRQA